MYEVKVSTEYYKELCRYKIVNTIELSEIKVDRKSLI